MFDKMKKKRDDIQTLRKYEARLRAMRKEYIQAADAYSLSDRKSRAAAVGECCLAIMDKVRELAGKHKLIEGSLEYMIDEQKHIDTDGRKGFHYMVTYHVVADEPKYTEEEIRAEIEDTAKRLRIETEELFKKDAEGDAMEEEK